MPELIIDARPYSQAILRFDLDLSTKLETLGHQLEEALPDIQLDTVKLLGKGGKALRVTRTDGTLASSGLAVSGPLRFKLLGSLKGDVNAVLQAQDAPAIASFEHEEHRERSRQAAPDDTHRASPDTFGRYQAWQYPDLVPPPSEALKLLQRLASDAGILKCMKKHGWKVGMLSEMPPAGKVGLSPVCVLGVNKNQGQEISLRLRTDDLRGFRRYDKIRETLIHELAHNVYSEHDDDFKKLNSQLRREVADFDWRGRAGARVVGTKQVVSRAPTLDINGGDRGTQPAGPQKLGGGAKGPDPRLAAAAAAEHRARAAELASHPVQASPPASPTPQKGDVVEYRQRDGTWVDAKVVAVDRSVVPPSYGVQLAGKDGGHYRETEAERLRNKVISVAEGASDIEGLGHRDAATEAKEREMERLET